MPIIPRRDSPASVAATQIKSSAVGTYQHLVNVFTAGASRFWKNPEATPQEIAEALGPEGAEVFQLHGAIGQLLYSIDPASVAEAMSMVGKFQYREDGSVEILPDDSQ